MSFLSPANVVRRGNLIGHWAGCSSAVREEFSMVGGVVGTHGVSVGKPLTYVVYS
jgi:hypothetical protein